MITIFSSKIIKNPIKFFIYGYIFLNIKLITPWMTYGISYKLKFNIIRYIFILVTRGLKISIRLFYIFKGPLALTCPRPPLIGHPLKSQIYRNS